MLALTGCASLPDPSPPAAELAGLPQHVHLDRVPFFPQDVDQCGPAALAMVLSYSGVPQTPQQMNDAVFLPGRQGSLQAEMLAATRRAGRLAYPLAPELGAVLHELAAGNAVVVLQEVGSPVSRRWHYAVVIGYYLDQRRLLLHSGAEVHLVLSWADFLDSWNPGGRWSFVALAPSVLPATAAEAAFTAAAADLERVSPTAAAEAYRAALGRWPQDLVARIGLGNVAYGRHDLEEAEAEYRRAAQDHVDAADAWNNLAQVLHERGRDGEATVAAERAVAIGGPRLPAYRATLQAIAPAAPR